MGVRTSKDLGWNLPTTQPVMRAVFPGKPEEMQHPSKDPQQLLQSVSGGLGVFFFYFHFLSHKDKDKTESCNTDSFAYTPDVTVHLDANAACVFLCYSIMNCSPTLQAQSGIHCPPFIVCFHIAGRNCVVSLFGAKAFTKQHLDSVVSSQCCPAPFSAAPMCRNRMVNVAFCWVSGISSVVSEIKSTRGIGLSPFVTFPPSPVGEKTQNLGPF